MAAFVWGRKKSKTWKVSQLEKRQMLQSNLEEVKIKLKAMGQNWRVSDALRGTNFLRILRHFYKV